VEYADVQIPNEITLVESSYWLDGGSITLHGVTESGSECRIHLTQRCFPNSGNEGRLYFNDELVDVRCNDELRIVELLRSAPIATKHREPTSSDEPPISKNALILSEDIRDFFASEPEQNLRRFRDEIVKFVESDEYVEIAKSGLPKRK